MCAYTAADVFSQILSCEQRTADADPQQLPRTVSQFLAPCF